MIGDRTTTSIDSPGARRAAGVEHLPSTKESSVMTQQQAPTPVFDKQDQFDKIRSGLLQGEQIIAVYDGKGVGTGFIAITDRRVIIQDNSFVGKKIALTSVPYHRITAVSFVADKSMFGKFASSSAISVSVAGREYEVEFRGEEKAKHVHDVVLWHLLNSK